MIFEEKICCEVWYEVRASRMIPREARSETPLAYLTFTMCTSFLYYMG